MSSILIMIMTGVLCIVSFFVGAKVGQNVATGKEIKAPNPITAISEYRAEKEEQKQREAKQIMLENIENYNGTSIGQKDV